MAKLIVEVCKIGNVDRHPNADRLDVAAVKGWNCIVGRNEFKTGDLCVYIPIDSILPEWLEMFLFSGTKVKLKRHRVRTIKLRGVVSQGLVVPVMKVFDVFNGKEGDDVADALQITKWEPPVKGIPMDLNNSRKALVHKHPDFHKYTHMNHINNYPLMLIGSEVSITEKIHGTNFRCGWVPYVPRTFFAKLKKFFWPNSKQWEFVFGSHNVQLQDGSKKQFYEGNVYARIVNQLNLKTRLAGQTGRIFYGEIYGSGIQTGYDYGLRGTAIDVAFIDILDVAKNRYLGWGEFYSTIISLGLKVAPVLYRGPYNGGLLSTYGTGESVLSGTQLVREGIVIKADTEFNGHGGRSILKYLNPDYLLKKDNSEWH